MANTIISNPHNSELHLSTHCEYRRTRDWARPDLQAGRQGTYASYASLRTNSCFSGFPSFYPSPSLPLDGGGGASNGQQPRRVR